MKKIFVLSFWTVFCGTEGGQYFKWAWFILSPFLDKFSLPLGLTEAVTVTNYVRTYDFRMNFSTQSMLNGGSGIFFFLNWWVWLKGWMPILCACNLRLSLKNSLIIVFICLRNLLITSTTTVPVENYPVSLFWKKVKFWTFLFWLNAVEEETHEETEEEAPKDETAIKVGWRNGGRGGRGAFLFLFSSSSWERNITGRWWSLPWVPTARNMVFRFQIEFHEINAFLGLGETHEGCHPFCKLIAWKFSPSFMVFFSLIS